MRKILLTVSVFLAGVASLGADVVTLPAAASIVGGAPFYSDVRAFNTSYTDSLAVTANYRCFIPQPCTVGTPQIGFTLGPRESKAFNDMVASAFASPNTAGGVEFEFSGVEEQLVVTSRLYSTAPTPTVGMFIPGLDESAAFPTTVLTSIRHNPATSPPSGFRANVGVFNPGDASVTVSFTIFDGGLNQLGVPVARTLAGHSGLQVSGIFEAAGVGAASTDNAVIVVSSSGAVFSYAAVIDNVTTDPIFVVGAADQPQQAITPVPTVTGVAPTPTNTSPPAPTPTPTPTPMPMPANHIVNVGQGGLRFVDSVSGNSTTTIAAGTTVEWDWSGGGHSTTSGSPCSPNGMWDSGVLGSGSKFSFTFPSAGTFSYFCSPHCGLGMTGTVIVQ